MKHRTFSLALRFRAMLLVLMILVLGFSSGTADIILITPIPTEIRPIPSIPPDSSQWIIPNITATPFVTPTPVPYITPAPDPYGRFQLPIYYASVSSYHNQNGDNFYNADKLIDYNDRTAWLYNYSRYGLSEENCFADLWLSYPRTVCQLRVRNGFWSSKAHYRNFSRANEIKVNCYDSYGTLAYTAKFTLADAGLGVEQMLDLGQLYDITHINFTVLSAYKGSDTTSGNLQYRFIAITELSAWGY